MYGMPDTKLMTAEEVATMLKELGVVDGKLSGRHTTYCTRHYAQYIKAIAEFDGKHPKACKHCGGTGMSMVYDSVDYGSTRATLSSTDTCGWCVDEGKCPVCAEALHETGACQCGWDGEDDDQEMVIRPEFECACYEIETDLEMARLDIVPHPGRDWVELFELADQADMEVEQ